MPVDVDTSSGITIRDLSIDWDIPLSAEATVEAATADYIDLRIDDRQFPYVIEAGKLVFVGEGWKSPWRSAMEFDGRTLAVVPGTGDAGCLGANWRAYVAESPDPGRVRLRHLLLPLAPHDSPSRPTCVREKPRASLRARAVTP